MCFDRGHGAGQVYAAVNSATKRAGDVQITPADKGLGALVGELRRYHHDSNLDIRFFLRQGSN